MRYAPPLFLLCALFVNVPAAAQSGAGTTGLMGLRDTDTPQLITLHDAFAKAGERSADLRIAALKVDEAEAQLTQAWAVLLPNIKLGFDYTFNYPEQKAAFGSAEQSAQQALLFESIANITAAQAAQTPDPLQRAAIIEQAEALRKSARDIRNAEVVEFAILPAHVVNGSLQVALPLFNARSWPLLQSAMGAIEITKLSTRQAQAGLLFGVARAYTQIVATKELVKITSEQIESATRQHTLVQQRHEQGYETALALERAALEVKKAEQQARQAKAGLRAAKAGLAGLLGVMDDFDVEEPPSFAPDTTDTEIDTLKTKAQDNRIDLRVQKELLKLADRQSQDAWLQLLPVFQLVAQGRYTSNTSGFTNQPFTGAIIVQGSLPIFDGGQTIGLINEKSAKVKAELLKVRQLEELIERELLGTLDDVRVKEENATTLKEVADLAQKTADNAEALYQEGVVRQTEVSDARLGAFAALVEAQRAKLDLEVARLGLAHATGELASLIKVDEHQPAPLTNEEADAARQAMDRVE